MRTFWRFLKENGRFLAMLGGTLGWIFAVMFLAVLYALEQTNITKTLSPQSWLGNYTNGIVGGFLGAMVGVLAIWWSHRSATEAQRQKRQAVGTALVFELEHNVNMAQTLTLEPRADVRFQNTMLPFFDQHLELFNGEIVYLLQKYRTNFSLLMAAERPSIEAMGFKVWDGAKYTDMPEVEDFKALAHDLAQSAYSARHALKRLGAVADDFDMPEEGELVRADKRTLQRS
jgi:hypothetical protein